MNTPHKKMSEIRDAEAEKFYKDSGWVPSEWAVMNFKAGFDCRDKLDNDALKLVVEVLEYYQKGKCTWIDGSINIAPANRALAEIRKMRGEG